MPRLARIILIAALAVTAANAAVAKKRATTKAGPSTAAGILVFTRFNCAFPFCPTTALDVVAIDEHFEDTPDVVLATLIPQTTTAEMNFLAYSDFDNTTRHHFTLAARPDLTQIFTVSVAMNGTAGTLVGQADVMFPATLNLDQITYLFTDSGYVYVAFADSTVVQIQPKTGAILSTFSIVPTQGQVVDSYGSAFDHKTGTFYVNAQGDAGFYLHTYNVRTKAYTNVGPLPAAAGTAGPTGARVDNTIASVRKAVFVPLRLVALACSVTPFRRVTDNAI